MQLNVTVGSHKTLSTTVDVLKKEYKAKEDKYLKEIIGLENKKKALDNVVYKMGQSTQTMPILTIVKLHDALSVSDTEEILELLKKVDKKYVKIEKKDLIIENDCLLELIICQDVMSVVMHADVESKIYLVHTHVNTLATIAHHRNMKKSYLDEYIDNLELQYELSKRNDMELLVHVSATCHSSSKQSERLIAVTSAKNPEKLGVISSTSANGSKPPGNTKKNRIS
ncbi:hypothetical protein Tco_0442820 [Tanacetum coccineum]